MIFRRVPDPLCRGAPQDPRGLVARADYIQTIPKRGYRLVAPVVSGANTAQETAIEKPAAAIARMPGKRNTRLISLAAAAIAALAIAILSFNWLQRSPDEQPQLTVEGAVVDGIHNDLLAQLARLSTFDTVISRTSTEQYRDTAKPISQIANELGVSNIVEGNVQQVGDQIRLTLSLIDADSDKLLWTRSYDEALTIENVFALQTEISRDIVRALDGVLTSIDAEQLVGMPTASLEAYSEYALGREAMTARTAEVLDRATAHFKKAIELDSEFAIAYVGLADTRFAQLKYDDLRWSTVAESTWELVERALEIDPLSAEAHTSLAYLQAHDERDLQKAEVSLRRAIALNDNYATAFRSYAEILSHQDRFEEAITNGLRAIALNPRDPYLKVALAGYYMLDGRLAESEAVLAEGIREFPDIADFYFEMGTLMWRTGRLDRTALWYREAARRNPDSQAFKYHSCNAYVHLGHQTAALECLQKREELFPEDGDMHSWLYITQHRYEEALAFPEKSAKSGSGEAILLRVYLRLILGKPGEARDLAERYLSPEVLDGKEFRVTAILNDLNDAFLFGYLHHLEGDTEKERFFHDQVLSTLRDNTQPPRPFHRYLQIAILALRDERQAAIDALRRWIDSDSRAFWFLLGSPVFDSMSDDPEWQELKAQLEADVARQREWFEANKQKPIEDIGFSDGILAAR